MKREVLVMRDTKAYLDRARLLSDKATSEFIKARQEKDETRASQAAEKGWLAVVSATNGLLAKQGLKIPKGTRRREDILFDLQKREKAIARLNLREKYGCFMRSLHIDAFYDGDVSMKRIERDLNKVKEYIKEVEKIVNRGNAGKR
jgi:hypothetical protein